jgi:hypothetical protein
LEKDMVMAENTDFSEFCIVCNDTQIQCFSINQTSIVSNRESKFMSVFWHELQKFLGMKLLMSIAFHPQMDGANEWANQSIGQILRTLVESNQYNLAAKCSMAELALNSSTVLLQASCPSS